MRSWKILTPLLGTACALAALAQPAGAPPAPAAPMTAAEAPSADAVVLQMRQAFRQGDKAQLAALLPLAAGHPLEPWAAYWALKARLDEALPDEVDAFLRRFAGTYQEDRLRNDWLRLLGQRRDWAAFMAHEPLFRMRDDAQVRCYALALAFMTRQAAVGDEVRRLWHAQRELDDGCLFAASRLAGSGQLAPLDIWRKARMAMHANRPALARAAVALHAPDASAEVAAIQANPVRWLSTQAARVGDAALRRALATLALVKLASSDPAQAAAHMDTWAERLTPEEGDWVWGAVAMRAALRLQDDAPAYYRRVQQPARMEAEAQAWMVRAALRAGDWREVLRAIGGMAAELAADPAWVYWKARALAATGRAAEATPLYQSIARASGGGFYEKLAAEALGQRAAAPPAPPPISPEEREGARLNAGLNRALYAIGLGLRGEGVREWNYAVNLHTPGGMGERQRHAAAAFACQHEVWDRCINTSERTQSFADYAQRFPTPHRAAVLRQAQAIGLDAAYVYGLIRQESRFVMDARSSAGASGLMQVMPATARWTARQIGLEGFSPSQINERDTNILIGTSYLKLALDGFQGSLPLAAAAYNAGPGRPRQWRNGPVLEGAIWAENIPFNETRTYVKNVLSNTVDYAALLTGRPQSLHERLGRVAPLPPDAPPAGADMP
ncbi:lytic transglycosylase domain-containing protein [Comamonadaceae bacterium OH2545_COT-014]|nr:lytic transglycosylase domain-containing protein [Comamonadaceae bacterium OH2545_COT-014]